MISIPLDVSDNNIIWCDVIERKAKQLILEEIC
jgi:hypothetical protein